MQDIGVGERTNSRINSLVFYCMLAGMCAWVLSLPLCPAQDGAAHKYYAWVVRQIVAGNSWVAHAYGIRHPIPPYATQDMIVVGLSHIMSLDQADKLFVCLVIVLTAVGTRLCCVHLGQGGRWTSLFVFPLLLSWSLLMGFMNYSLGIGLMLLIYACWMRAADGKALYWAAFCLFAIVLAFTHPLPLLLVLALCCYDCAAQWYVRRRSDQSNARRVMVPQLMALGLLALEMCYPLLHTDAKRTGSGLLSSMFRFRAYLTDLTLVGVSPYARHSHTLPLVAYKCVLYAVLLSGLIAAARGLGSRWRAERLDRNDALLVLAVALYLTLPLTPDWINGAALGARLLILVWFGLLMAASRMRFAPAQTMWLTGGALLAFFFTLLPAQNYLRPAALQVAAIERLRLPWQQNGLILLQNEAGGKNAHLELDPDLWAPMLAMMHAQDVMVNSPWLDQIYYLVKPEGDMHLMFNLLPTMQARHAIDMHDGSISFLPESDQERIIAASDFVILEDSVARKRTVPGHAAEFSCTQQGSLSLCLRKQAAF